MTEEEIRNLKVGDRMNLYNPFTSELYEELTVDGIDDEEFVSGESRDPRWHPAIWVRGKNEKYMGWIPHWWMLYMCTIEKS